jgi:hypothetical protein
MLYVTGPALPPSPPAEKATTRQDQAGQSRTRAGPSLKILRGPITHQIVAYLNAMRQAFLNAGQRLSG